MAQYTLYAHRNSYAMTTHLMLEELRADYEIVWFNVHNPIEFPSEFVELNPLGRVPVLITPHGPINESAATIVYLSEAHGDRFFYKESSHSRSRGLQWLFFFMSTFQPEVLIQFDPDKYFPKDSDEGKALINSSLNKLEKLWIYINNQIENGPYLLGEEYSICDMLFMMQAIWAENQPSSFNHLPKIKLLMKEVAEREAVKKVLAIHKVSQLTDITCTW